MAFAKFLCKSDKTLNPYGTPKASGRSNGTNFLRLIPEYLYDELAMAALIKNPIERTSTDLQYMTRYFKKNTFFTNYNDDVILRCCQDMAYSKLQDDTIIYRRSEALEDADKKLYLVLTGEIGIFLLKPKVVRQSEDSHLQIMTIKQQEYFGSQLFLEGKDDYFEIPGLIVKCKKQCEVATIDQAHFTDELIQLEVSRLTNEVSQLYKFPIFSSITFVLLKKFYINSFRMRYQYNETVYSQHDQCEVVYVVLSGMFQLIQTVDKKQQCIALLSAGELIGEHEIMNQQPNRQYTVVCTSEKGVLLAFDSQFFRSYVYQMLKRNVEGVIIKKNNFHSQKKIQVKEELTQLKSLCTYKSSFKDIQKTNKLHYQLKPRQDNSIDNKESDSYYELFVQLYANSSKSNNLHNSEKNRRISHYIKNTLKPLQNRLKQSQKMLIKSESSMEPFGSTSYFFKNMPLSRTSKVSPLKLSHHKQVSVLELNIRPSIVTRQYKTVEKLMSSMDKYRYN